MLKANDTIRHKVTLSGEFIQKFYLERERESKWERVSERERESERERVSERERE